MITFAQSAIADQTSAAYPTMKTQSIPRDSRHTRNAMITKRSSHSIHQSPHFCARVHHRPRPHRHLSSPLLRPNAAAPSVPPYSDSEDSDNNSINRSSSGAIEVDLEALAAAEQSIAEQQAAGLPPPYDLAQTKRIVETAMLAAVAGLSYSVAVLLKLEGYLSYVLPLPVVLAAVRGGATSAVKCLTVAFLLLFIIVGPFRAVAYLLVYGLLSLGLGATFSLNLPWSIGVPVAALARVAGFLAYLSLSSFFTNENLMAITLNNIYAMLDQFSAVTGGGGAPTMTAVAVTLISLFFVNSTFYVFMMHLLYTLILRGMGYSVGRVPKFLQKLVGTTTTPATL